MSNQTELASTVLRAIYSVWEDWSKSGATFSGERPAMQIAFADSLTAKLPDNYSVFREARLPVEGKLSAWRMYDIAVRNADRLVGLVELSYGDTNVAHALHNGELKLLGACAGIGVSTGRPYAAERGLSDEDLAALQRQISAVRARGLFFVNPGPKPVVDLEAPAMWWETKAKGFQGESRFWSALMAPARTVTLRSVFSALAAAGISSWFYSLCGEEPIAYTSRLN